jgi:hypothetical protein
MARSETPEEPPRGDKPSAPIPPDQRIKSSAEIQLKPLADLVGFKYNPSADSVSYETQFLFYMIFGQYLRGKSSKGLQVISNKFENMEKVFSEEDKLLFWKAYEYLRGWIGALEHLKERI